MEQQLSEQHLMNNSFPINEIKNVFKYKGEDVDVILDSIINSMNSAQNNEAYCIENGIRKNVDMRYALTAIYRNMVRTFYEITKPIMIEDISITSDLAKMMDVHDQIKFLCMFIFKFDKLMFTTVENSPQGMNNYIKSVETTVNEFFADPICQNKKFVKVIEIYIRVYKGDKFDI